MEGWDIPFRKVIVGALIRDADVDDDILSPTDSAQDTDDGDRWERVDPRKEKAAEWRGVDVALAVTNNANRVSLISTVVKETTTDLGCDRYYR